jgi:hypothetical protein
MAKDIRDLRRHYDSMAHDQVESSVLVEISIHATSIWEVVDLARSRTGDLDHDALSLLTMSRHHVSHLNVYQAEAPAFYSLVTVESVL